MGIEEMGRFNGFGPLVKFRRSRHPLRMNVIPFRGGFEVC